jgi:hypothetical protein
VPQVPLQEFGAAVGLGVAVDVGPGVPVGVTVGEADGDDDGVVVAEIVNDSEQAVVGAGVVSWACGMLEGTLGATGCCFNW